MRSLIIKELKYIVETVKGNTYGATVQFDLGLNIIYGPNSVGKTSLVTGIIYALGGEKSLGIFQSKQNAFKPEFYDSINGEKVATSQVVLLISNGEQTVSLNRSIINKTNSVELKEYDSQNNLIKKSFLIASGDGVFSEDGLQAFLFEFLKWKVVDVPTYDSGVSKLYFENLLPLFFIEQRAGWAQIQARQVSRYGIREVKKVAFEYLMGLDRFNIHLKEIRKKEISEILSRRKQQLLDKEEDLLVVVNGKKEDGIIKVQRTGTARTSIYDVITILENRYLEDQKSLNIIEETKDTSTNQEETLREQVRITSYQVRKLVEKANSLIQEINGYEGYIERIKINQRKNKQVKKLEGLVKELNIATCPVCENPLLDHGDGSCTLCHQKNENRISTPEENLEFLEDEKSTFEKIKDSKKLELRKTRAEIDNLKEKEKSLIENLDHQIKTYVGPELDKYRKKVLELDMLHKDIQLLKRTGERWNVLDGIRNEITKLTKELDTISEDIKKYQQSYNDGVTLSTVLSNFKNNVKAMRLLKNKDELLNSIKLNFQEHYTPFLEDFDLYNISSSSDNVRIILSYYLSLLQTSVQLTNPEIKFPTLLIFDEPKQQNLDEVDLIKFIEIIEGLASKNIQVIMTTFNEGKENKERFEKYIKLEMKDSDDYLLKKITNNG